MKGVLISFEGIDYCGKSTQLKKTESYLKEKGIPVMVGVEPGSTALGQVLRRILKQPQEVYSLFNRTYGLDLQTNQKRTPEAELFLFLAARAEFTEHTVKPGLEKGLFVLADRYADSTRAYQGGGRYQSRREITQEIDRLNNIATKGIWPAKTFLLDIPYETMLKRLGAKAKDYIESFGEEFFTRVREEYKTIAKENPERVVLIDGTLPPDDIFEKSIVPHVETLINNRQNLLQ